MPHGQQSQSAAPRLLAFFERVAQRDPALLGALRREARFGFAPGRWCFGLPDLHAFLQRRDAVFRSMDYTSFRTLLFDSPVNRAVRTRGAEIVIADNRGKVDRSRYALRWDVGRPVQ